MAKIEGGITSRPSGQLGNIIFGAARTPEGKVVTAREAVKPSNPDTPAQQAQRSKFQQALDIVQAIGPSIYQTDWNRAVGQLPGFQSWQSVLLNNIDDSDVLQAPPTRPLGNLHFPDNFSVDTGSTSSAIDITHSTETGENGTDQDEVVAIAIEASDPGGRNRDVEISDGQTTRQANESTLAVAQASTEYVVCFYYRGADNADGLLSPAEFRSVTSSA